MAGPTLAQLPSLPKALGLVEQKDAESAVKIQEMFRELGTNVANQAAAVREGTFGKNQESLAVLQFQDEQQAIADTIKAQAAAAAGFSADATTGIQNILLQDITQMGMKAREIAKTLEEDKAVSLFDDPLTAIANAFTIPWKEQELQGTLTRQTLAAKTLAEVNSNLTATAATAEALKAKVGAAGVAANAKARAADMEKAALTIEYTGLKDGITALKEVRDADERSLTHIRIATEFYNNQRVQARADEHLALARKQDTREAEAAIQRMKEGKEREEDRAIIRKADETKLALANRARAEDGLLPYTSIGEWKSKYDSSPAGRKMLDDEIDRGRRLMTPGFAPTDSFGPTVAGKLEYIRNHGIEPKTPQERAFAKILLEAESIQAKAKIKGDNLKAEDVIVKRMKEWENYKKGDASNPNAPVSYETLASDPVISANPLFAKIIAPMITDSNKKLAAEPNEIFSRLTAAMIEKPSEVNPDQAARLMTFIYNKSTELNNKNNKPYKWLSQAPTRITAELEIGIDPRMRAGADIVTATGAAMMASGVGLGAGAAISAVGIGAEAYALTGGVQRIDLSDLNQVKQAFVKKVVSQVGFTLNTKKGAEAFSPGTVDPSGNASMYARDANGKVISTPLFERNRILESKGGKE